MPFLSSCKKIHCFSRYTPNYSGRACKLEKIETCKIEKSRLMDCQFEYNFMPTCLYYYNCSYKENDKIATMTTTSRMHSTPNTTNQITTTTKTSTTTTTIQADTGTKNNNESVIVLTIVILLLLFVIIVLFCFLKRCFFRHGHNNDAFEMTSF